MEVAKVATIFVYPIKSCRGISVSRAPLTPTGIRWDRNWMVVNYKGRGITQRVEPKLALVDVILPNDAFLEDWTPLPSSFMELRAPGMDALKLQLTKPSQVVDGISVWEWSGAALDEGPEAAQWFTDFLGKPSRLVRFHTESEDRPVDTNYASGQNVQFADGYPFLLISQGSLNAINELLDKPVPINRFRPTIFVDGCDPFAEDLWRELKIGNSTFEGVKLCSRCKTTTVNQETGEVGKEPLETLKKFRMDKVISPHKKSQGKTFLGQNVVWKDRLTPGKGKVINVGDSVVVVKKYPSVADVPV